MKILLPNAKELNTNLDSQVFSELNSASEQVLSALLELSVAELATFYGIKPERAELERDRWLRIQQGQAKTYPAWQLYDGLMYRYMKRWDLPEQELTYLKAHALIATGFYGLIGLFELISPHRLDFQGSLQIAGQSLKQFWRPAYDEAVAGEDTLISFLSSEFEAVFSPAIQKGLIKVVFMEEKEGKKKVHSTISKKGRGSFLSAMAEYQVETLDQLKALEVDGFVYQPDLSSQKELVFVR